MRTYKCLTQIEFSNKEYTLTPIRDEDKYDIMAWRNDQIEILRQKEPLTREKQEWYFENVVNKLFDEEAPSQLLFSFLNNGILVGYGGLVHIDWESKVAEISFLTPKNRALNEQLFYKDWSNYLELLFLVAFEHLQFIKIFTYAYSFRFNLFPILLEKKFTLEAELKNHVRVGNKYYDVIIHSKFNNN